MNTQVMEYSTTEVALADLAKRFKGIVFDVATTKGMEEAKKARAEIRGYRTSLEALRQELKAPILERGKLLDDEAKRIKEALESLEKPIDGLIKTEEARKEAEKEAKKKAEASRIQEIMAQIKAISELPISAISMGSTALAAAIEHANKIVVGEQFGEFVPEGEAAKSAAIEKMVAMLADKKAADVEAARLDAERKEFERKRAEEEASQRAERERLEQQRQEQERAAKAQQDELDRQRAEIEEAQRKQEAEAVATAAPVAPMLAPVFSDDAGIRFQIETVISSLNTAQLNEVLAFAKKLAGG